MASSVSFSGIASGIDTDALIDASISAKRQQRITPLEDKISEAEDESAAITTLKEKLLSLKDKLAKYNTLSGGTVQKESFSTDELVASAVVSNNANLGSYDIKVNQLAKRGIFTLGEQYPSQNSKIITSGSGQITINVGTGDNEKTLNIQVTNSMTLSELVDTINSSNVGCEAVCVNVGTTQNPSYTVMITSSNEGTSKGTLSVTTNGANATLVGLINNGSLSQAQDAKFSIAGLASDIQRDSNTINDTIPGVTFSLKSLGSATVDITNDTYTTESNIKEIVDSLNDIFKFVADNNTVERQEDGDSVSNIFAALAKTSVDNNVVTSIKNVMMETKNANGAYVRIFADFGITTDSQKGTLNFDTEKFEESFAKESKSINYIFTKFADTMSSTGGTIDQYTRYNGLLDIVINNNTNQISDYNDRISRYESMLAKEEDSMRSMYAKFESLMSEMQNSANSLTSLLGSMK